MTARRGSAEGLTSEEKWEAYIQERYGLTVSEYDEWLEDLRREKSEHLTSPKVEWPDEPDLPMAPTPDPLPVDLFPKVLRDQIKSVAGALQVPSDLPSILSIVSCSAGLGGKILATIDAKWKRVWCVFYGVAVLPSGERKSGAFVEMFRPIYEWLKDEQKSIEPAYRTAMDRVEVREQELAQAKKRRPTDFTDINARRTDLETAKAMVPYKPTWACDDVTSEALVEAMAMNDGRAALLSPEGGPLRNLDGRYSDGVANTEVFKKGHDGELIEELRKGREGKVVPHPALTMGITLQPTVFETLKNKKILRGEGVWARCGFVQPKSKAGYRDHRKAPDLDTKAEARYRSLIRAMCDFDGARNDDDELVPKEIAFTKEALEILYDFMAEYELEKRPGGRLRGILEWAEKAHSQVVRISVFFALADRLDKKEDPLADIEVGWVEAGIAVVRALSTHALYTFERMESDGQMSLLRYVLDKAIEMPEGSDRNELNRRTQGKQSISGAEHLSRLTAELQKRGCLYEKSPSPTGKAGQPKSPVIVINPALRIERIEDIPVEDNSLNILNASDTVPDTYGPFEEAHYARR